METTFFVMPIGNNLPFNKEFLLSCITQRYATKELAIKYGTSLSRKYDITVLIVESFILIETPSIVQSYK